MTTKKENKKDVKIFEFRHTNGDVFTYNNDEHEYRLNGVELPGTTTPLILVNELSWNSKGVMSDKTQIIKNWAIKLVVNEAIEKVEELKLETGVEKNISWVLNKVIDIIKEAKKKPNQRFKEAGISGTDIHDLIEQRIKYAINSNKGFMSGEWSDIAQVNNFEKWAFDNDVKFLYSEEALYSKEWMNCGTVDFICEIDGKTVIGDIKTNGEKRRYESVCVRGEWVEDKTKPVSDIHIPALWQTGAYGKMATELDARKLIDKFDGVVVVNIKKSGEFDEKLDVRYNYNPNVLVEAYDHVIKLYKLFRNQVS